MAKLISLIVGVLLMFSSCYSLKKSLNSSLPYSEKIYWPDEYEPKQAKFFVYNEIEIDARPEAIWKLLIRAESWPDWYRGAKNVQIQIPDTTELTPTSVFKWKTMGLNFTSTIREFEPPYRLSWESRQKKIKGYHAWLIIPSDHGSKLITTESQNGWLTFFEKTFQPNKLRKLHDV